MRSRSLPGDITRERAAASSMASGRRSSKATRDSTCGRSPADSVKPGFADRARAANRSTASGTDSGGRGRDCSPGSPSTSRLVTTKHASLARSSHRPTVSSACRATCSKLSSSSRQRPRPAMAWPSCTMGSPPLSGTSRAVATDEAMPSTLRASDRSQNQTPPGNAPSRSRPARSARRVLPVPPMPRTETRGPWCSASVSRARSRARPTKASRSRGRLWGWSDGSAALACSPASARTAGAVAAWKVSPEP